MVPPCTPLCSSRELFQIPAIRVCEGGGVRGSGMQGASRQRRHVTGNSTSVCPGAWLFQNREWQSSAHVGPKPRPCGCLRVDSGAPRPAFVSHRRCRVCTLAAHLTLARRPYYPPLPANTRRRQYQNIVGNWTQTRTRAGEQTGRKHQDQPGVASRSCGSDRLPETARRTLHRRLQWQLRGPKRGLLHRPVKAGLMRAASPRGLTVSVCIALVHGHRSVKTSLPSPYWETKGTK